MRIYSTIFLLLLFIPFNRTPAQTRVTFFTADSLEVVADKYFVSDSLPWILMFHQAGSSRGEFIEIAPKLIKLGYNGLAVDLRHGKEINFVANETFMAARRGNHQASMADATKDINAAIEWATERSDFPVILLGSSYSASLAMIAAKKNPHAGAVIAFSPGEFFGHPGLVQNAVRNLDVPVFLASTKREYPYVTELSSGINSRNRYIFTPSEHQGVHGARALWETEECSQEYWLGLLLFFNDLNNHIKK